MPPERVDPLLGTGDADPLQQLGRLGLGLCPGRTGVLAVDLAELPAHRENRVQRRQRVLEDDRDLVLPYVPAGALVHRQQVDAAELDGAAGHLRRRCVEDAHDRLRGHRLAAAGLAQDPQRLALAQGEGDPVDRLGDAVAGVELDLEVLDLQQRRRAVELHPGERGLVGALL
jgi:hypothetical protein